LHLAGSGEPLLIPFDKFEKIISPFRKEKDCQKISVTSNGYFLEDRLDDLIKLGIYDVNVSIPCLDPKRYQSLMQVTLDEATKIIEKTKRGIELARKMGLVIDINVCVSYDIREYLNEFIDLSRKLHVPIKFFPVIAVPSINISSENDHFKLLITHLSRIKPPTIESTGRYMMVSWDIDDARLCLKPGDVYKRPQECYQCACFLRCEESCWQSVRISPWYIQPCGIRTDNIYWYEEQDVSKLREQLIIGGKLSGDLIWMNDIQKTRKEILNKTSLGKFVVIEGPDGSGKTTIAKEIAKRLGYLYYRTPPSIFQNDEIKKSLECDGLEISRYLYYLSSMHYANLEVFSLLSCVNIVCDRWIQSTHIYHNVLTGGEAKLPAGFSQGILEPDLLIVLDVDHDTQNERLNNRQIYFDYIWESNEKRKTLIKKEYDQIYGEKIIHIGNIGSIDETLEKCLEVIKNL
jgi:thymidylate kinase/MoaA/NifB/PqqE/SkfB family radical SAM enzyme